MTGEEGGDAGLDDEHTRAWNANIRVHVMAQVIAASVG